MPIAKQDFDHLMNQARVKLVGASDAGIKGELFDVLLEFFNDSSCWLEGIQFNVLTDTNTYVLTPDEGQIIRLVGVFDSYSQPQPALMPNIGTVILGYMPNAQQAPLVFTAVVAKNIVLPTNKDMIPVGPDWFLPVWHVGVLDGLLGKMMTAPNKSYSNTERGEYHLKRFRGAIARARVSALRQNTFGSQAWRFPGTFRTNNQQSGVPGFGGNDRSF